MDLRNRQRHSFDATERFSDFMLLKASPGLVHTSRQTEGRFLRHLSRFFPGSPVKGGRIAGETGPSPGPVRVEVGKRSGFMLNNPPIKAMDFEGLLRKLGDSAGNMIKKQISLK